MTAIPPKNRRPYIWQPPQVPRLSDLFANAEARRRLLTYWCKDGLLDLRDAVLFPIFRLLPIRFASWLGGWIFRVTTRDARQVHKQVRDNLRRIRPDLDQATRETLAVSHFDNIGRVTAEFPLLTRLHASGRMGIEGGDILKRLHAEGPVILLGMHLANWELVYLACARLGIPLVGIYKPPPRAAQLRIAVQTRESLGLKLLPPGLAGARPALRVLQSGGVLGLFGDEEHEGRVMAPFFGRPHLNGNLGITARLARMTGAKIILFYGERRPGGVYTQIFAGPIILPSQKKSDTSLLDDVLALNAAIDPIIRAHSGTWFFLAHARPENP